MSEATRFLVEIGQPDDSVANRFINPIDPLNYVSPSAWVNDLIASVTGVDIFGKATDFISGEWDALWKFGDAMINLAQCMQEMGIEIQKSTFDLDGSWDGNAGDAAFTYFTALATAISGQQTALRTAGNGYHQAARGAWQLSSQLGNLLQNIADKGILLGISCLAGTATMETGIGAVAGYGMAAYQAAQIVSLVNKASTIINTGGTVILGGFGGALDFTGRGGNLATVALPASYALPGA
jgi:hypothetical protein